MRWFKFNIGDYAASTAHLSFIEDAVYSRLLRKYYADEGPIQGSIAQVQRLIGAKTKVEKAAVRTILEEFFECGSSGWQNVRCDIEIAQMQSVATKNKEIALQREENRRKDRSKQSTVRAPQQDETCTLGQPTHHPSPITQEKSEKHSSSAAPTRGKRFDEFWEHWPKKVAKADALKVWKGRKLDAVADEIIAHVVERAAHDPAWANRLHIPHPAKFLRGDQWTDDWRGASIANPARDGSRPSRQAQGDAVFASIARRANEASAGTASPASDAIESTARRLP